MAEKTMQELAVEMAALKAGIEAMSQEISILKIAVAAGGQQAGRKNISPAEKAKLKEAFLTKVKGK